jgi:hypothetical protein
MVGVGMGEDDGIEAANFFPQDLPEIPADTPCR